MKNNVQPTKYEPTAAHDRAKVYWEWIASRKARLEKHKTQLLAILHKVRQVGDLDEAGVWSCLETIAHVWADRDFFEENDPAVRKHYRKIAASLREVRDLIGEEDSVTYNDLALTYCNGNTEIAQEIVTRKLGQILESIVRLEGAACRLGTEPDRNAGRPEGSDCPPDLVQSLARIYVMATERQPGKGFGPFANFVAEFMRAIDRPNLALATIVDNVKSALSPS